jgi:uncharacterized coiled-coil DUF342 family protein
LSDLADVRPDYDELLEAIDARDEGLDTLRAELAGAQAQAAAARRERDAMAAAGREVVEAADKMREEWGEILAARDAEVPGLSTTPGYTMDDVDRIEAARGKPYAKLRETVEQLEELAAEFAEYRQDDAQDRAAERANGWSRGTIRELEQLQNQIFALRSALEEVRQWRRAAVGLEPRPVTDAETLGERIDAALAATGNETKEVES